MNTFPNAVTFPHCGKEMRKKWEIFVKFFQRKSLVINQNCVIFFQAIY